MSMKKFDLQLFAEDEKKTPPADTADTGDKEEQQEQTKTFTQAEVDAVVKARLAREKKDLPGEDELKAFRAWQESQQTETEKHQHALQSAAKERDDALSEAEQLRQQLAALGKGIPADKADKYVYLAKAYMAEQDGLELAAALDKALVDFPLAEGDGGSGGVPGAGGNPPKTGEKKEKKARPSGTTRW